jgi:hypothetical protein
VLTARAACFDASNLRGHPNMTVTLSAHAINFCHPSKHRAKGLPIVYASNLLFLSSASNLRGHLKITVTLSAHANDWCLPSPGRATRSAPLGMGLPTVYAIYLLFLSSARLCDAGATPLFREW